MDNNPEKEIRCAFYENLIRDKGLVELAKEFEEEERKDKEIKQQQEQGLEKDFIYVPSINLYVAKQKTHLGLNWNDTHKALADEDSRMLLIPEFLEFLKYSKTSFPDIYKEIAEVRTPWRSEWLDAYFKKEKDGLHILTGNKTKAEKIESCLMENSYADILNPNKQGLPIQKTNSGFYYWYPMDKCVAGFYANSVGADLYCYGLPSNQDSWLGVRAVKKD